MPTGSRLKNLSTRLGRIVDARRTAAIGLVVLTVGLVGCTTATQEPSVTEETGSTTSAEGGEEPAGFVSEIPGSAEIVEVNDGARSGDRGKDPAVVCHWASNKYVTIVVSINAALNGHGNHENDVIFFHTDDETLCDDLPPPGGTTTTVPEATTSTSSPSSTTSTTDPSATSTSTTSSSTTSSTTSTSSSTTSTTDPSTTTSSSTAPGGSTTTTDPGVTSTTTDASTTSTTETTDVGSEELPHTGISVPPWVLALIGAGLILSGSGLVRLARNGDSPSGDR